MTELEVVGSTPLSSFVSIGEDAVYREASSSSIGHDVDGKSIQLHKGGLVPWRTAIAMVVFASLAAVAVLIQKCVAAFRREGGERAIRRKLSEKVEATADSEDDVECAVGEGLGGLSPPQQPASAEKQQEDGQPPAKQQRLDSSSADGAAGETSRTQSEAAAAAGLMLLSQQQAAPSPSSETHVAPSQQSAEGVPLLLPVIILPPQPYFIVLRQGGSPGHPLPSTSAGAVGGSSDGAASAGSSLPQPHQQEGLGSSAEERPGDSQRQPQESLFPRAVDAGETSAPSAPPASPSSDEPSTSSGFLPQRGESLASGRPRAFGRLPELQNATHGLVFDPKYALPAPALFTCLYRMFGDLTKLFGKESLTSEELKQTVRIAEKLAAHAANHETTKYDNMSTGRSMEIMARRFIMLYFVVSTCQLVGTKPSGEWWNKIVTGVPHAVPRPKPFGPCAGWKRYEHCRSLMDMFSSAIQILKTGQRPSEEELANIKRSTFSRLAPAGFQKPNWDFWRKDDEEPK